jgi:hypothetical protein
VLEVVVPEIVPGAARLSLTPGTKNDRVKVALKANRW